MPAPALPVYLSTPYASKPWQRGGTLIDEEVWEVDEHHRKLASPDDYRPSGCPRCGQPVHSHGRRWRRLRDEPGHPGEEIRRYRCPPCGAVWQVLPGFLARHVHRGWGAVQSRLVAAGALAPSGAEWRVPAKISTTRRWVARLLASALALTQALAACGAAVWSVIAARGAGCSRRDLVEGLAAAGILAAPRKLGQLAGWIHRLVPGVRVM